MAKSRFKVVGTFDIAGGLQTATVEIDRAAGLFSVRPYKRRKVYTLPLSVVAAIVCQRIIVAEVREKRAAKAAKKKSRKSRVKP